MHKNCHPPLGTSTTLRVVVVNVLFLLFSVQPSYIYLNE